MKTPTTPNFRRTVARRILAATIQPAALALLLAQAQAGNTWDGGGGDANWGTGDNWNPNGAPGYGTLVFSGNTQTTNSNNSITAMNQVNWNGTAAWVMNGTVTLSLFDNGGTQAKLESLGSGGVSINANITYAANNGGPPNPFGELNAVNSNIAFTGGTLTVNGSSVNGIKLFGGAGRDVSFANTVSASGKWFGFTNTNGSSVTIASGASVTTGDFYVMNGGTLNLAGGSLTTSAVRLGGDFGNTGHQNQAFGGTVALTPAAGGVSFGSTINAVSGNTSNALLIDSQNTSGTNTITSGIFLDSDLKIQQGAGGSLAFSTGTFDVKNRKLTVDGAGTTTINQVLSSSLGAGGSLVKLGSGTLILANTANTYSGTNNATLNANSTQIGAGTLGIHGDGSLGNVPSAAYNNIQFTGSATLQDTANNITLAANRNISIASGATGTFDSNGNFFTIGGIINGSGNVAISGSGGTVKPTGTNTYTGTTTINSGTLQISSSVITSTAGPLGNASSDIGLGEVGGSADATLQANSASTVTVDRDITVNSGTGDRIISNIGSGLYRIDSFFDVFTELTIDGGAAAGNIELNGNISESTTGSGLTKNGTGTAILNGNNTFTGATTINAGTLEAGAAGALGGTAAITVNSGGTLLLDGSGNRINDSAALTLAGGTFATGGLSETLGTLTLTANSIIDFGAGISVLTFADSSSINWNGFTLSLHNWSGTPYLGGGTDQLRFLSDGLTATQLGLIHFYSDAGATEISFSATYPTNGFVGSLGEVVPVPEPSSVLLGLAMFGLAGWRERRHADTRRRASRLAVVR